MIRVELKTPFTRTSPRHLIQFLMKDYYLVEERLKLMGLLLFFPTNKANASLLFVNQLHNVPDTRTPKSSHITPVLKSLHWLKINERIKYKLLSLTYNVTSNQPQYLHNLISVQPCCNTRSSSMITLTRPPTRSTLKITNRSFQ